MKFLFSRNHDSHLLYTIVEPEFRCVIYAVHIRRDGMSVIRILFQVDAQHICIQLVFHMISSEIQSN